MLKRSVGTRPSRRPARLPDTGPARTAAAPAQAIRRRLHPPRGLLAELGSRPASASREHQPRASAVVVVVVVWVSVIVGTLTGPLGQLSAAWLTVVPTAAGSGAHLSFVPAPVSLRGPVRPVHGLSRVHPQPACRPRLGGPSPLVRSIPQRKVGCERPMKKVTSWPRQAPWNA